MAPSLPNRAHGPMPGVPTPLGLLRDPGLRGILLTNGITLVLAVWQDWGVLQLLWPFWVQSLVIGWYARKRILALTPFHPDGTPMELPAGEPVPEMQRSIANFFAIHYGGFHLGYLLFLLGFTVMAGLERLGRFFSEGTGEFAPGQVAGGFALDLVFLLVLAFGFWTTHRASHREHVAADLENNPNIAGLMFLPYARIVPMHLCILAALPLDGAGIIWLFILLKTGADVLMHVVEHRVLQGVGPAAGGAGAGPG